MNERRFSPFCRISTIVFELVVLKLNLEHVSLNIVITQFLSKFLTEHIESVCRENSPLFFIYLCSIGFRSRKRDFREKLTSFNCDKNHYFLLCHDRASDSACLVFLSLSIFLGFKIVITRIRLKIQTEHVTSVCREEFQLLFDSLCSNEIFKRTRLIKL